MFGTFIGSTSGYRFYTISDSTKRYYVDDSRGQYRYYPILFRPLSSSIDYLSTETFQFHVESTVWDYWKEDLLRMFCYFAPVIRHSVQTGNQILIKLVYLIRPDKEMHSYTWWCEKLSFPLRIKFFY